MTAYPDGPLDLRAELLLGSTWTDITQWAMPDGSQYADITGGTSDGASQPSPATLNATWDNADGRFSPRNVSGPWYGLLKRGTMARVSCAAPETYLRVPAGLGASGGCPAISSGVLDVRLDFDFADWRSCIIAGCGTASGSYSWQIGVDHSGRIIFWWSADGANWNFTYLTPEWPKFRQCLRIAYDTAAGTVSFYSAPADSPLATATWTLLGSGSGAAGLHGTSGVYIGGGGAFTGLQGSVWRMSVYQGSTGKSFFDATLRAAGATSWTDSLGNAWTVSGGAEISGRDYVLHGELASIVPSVTVPGTDKQAAVQIAGPLRAIQSGSAPPADSPYRRAVTALTGTAAPVAYWPCDDTGGPSVASGLPGGLPAAVSGGTPEFASDSAFACSKPLMSFNGSDLRGTVGGYTDHGALVVRFLVHLGQVPSSGYWSLVRLYLTGGSCQLISLRVYPSGLGLAGVSPSGATVFDTGGITFDISTPLLVSVEITPVSGGVQYMIQTMPPGSPTSWYYGTTVSGAVRGKLFKLDFNSGRGLTDTSVGHVTVQSSLTSVWDMSAPLQAWAGETAGNRFLRVAAEEGYDAKITGSPDVTIPMGNQPAGTIQAILQDIAQADGGLLYEPPGSYSIGYRTLASMYNQAPALTLDYAAGSLPGTAQAADDDTGLVNDWTVSQPDGSSARVHLDDPAVSTSTAANGTYQDTATANTWTAGALLDAAGRLLALSAADEARYRQVSADAGIPGTDARAIGAMRIGNLIQLLNPPPSLQSGPVRQIVTGQEKILGPGRKATWDCQPASAYDTAVYGGKVDTAGSTLTLAASATATTLTADSTGVIWSPLAADWPFTIACGGEQMTVMHVTGSTSPQTLTVTRGVNGTPALAHPAGADVRLARTPRYSAI